MKAQSRKLSRRVIPVYEFKGYKIRVYETKGRYSAHFIGPNQRRHRVEKHSEHDAVEEAKERIRELGNPEAQQQLMEEKSAADLLSTLSMSPIEAARVVVTATNKLRPFNIGIPEAVDYFVTRHQGSPITVEQLVDELISVKDRDTGLHNKKNLISKLRNGFCKKFGQRLIGSIVASELTIYITSYPGAKRTRRNQHSALVTLFEYAKKHGYLASGTPTEMDSVDKPKAGKPAKNIFAPSELELLIDAALTIYSPAFATLLIQAMAGVRTEELCQTDPKKDRLRWTDVYLDQPLPEIHIREEVSKTTEERFIPIPPALTEWLSQLRLTEKNSNDPVYSDRYIYKDYRKIMRKAAVVAKRNGLRKSFNTYDRALSGSFQITSKAAGNSPTMMKRYYDKPTSQVGLVALEWFSILPAKFGPKVVTSIEKIKNQNP